jgi:hypothetical protein
MYGNSDSLGKTASKALSTSFPCQISLLQTHFKDLTSQTENGGKL